MNRTTEAQSHRELDGSHTAGELLDLASAELRATSGDDARLEAEVMLAHALGMDRSRLLAGVGDRVARDAAGAFEGFVSRRFAREPLAYIIGQREFYGIEIACSPAALIPRPETEMLVGLALDETGRRAGAASVCDVGTGSGAIAVAIAVRAPNAQITATDTSEDALALARENARRHAVENRIDLRPTDLLDGLDEFDVVVANLPYVSEAEWLELEPEIRDHEPRAALVGGPAGVEIIERLVRSAPEHLHAGGLLGIEIGAIQGERAMRIAHDAFPRARIELLRDLAGLDRVVAVYTQEDA